VEEIQHFNGKEKKVKISFVIACKIFPNVEIEDGWASEQVWWRKSGLKQENNTDCVVNLSSHIWFIWYDVSFADKWAIRNPGWKERYKTV